MATTARSRSSSNVSLSLLISTLFLPVLSCCLESFGGTSPLVGAAQVFGQKSQQEFLHHQEPIFENEGDWVSGEEEEVGGWEDWQKGKYVVKDPFDEEFDRMVEETLQHWHVPGLSVAVVHGDDTFAKVSTMFFDFQSLDISSDEPEVEFQKPSFHHLFMTSF